MRRVYNGPCMLAGTCSLWRAALALPRCTRSSLSSARAGWQGSQRALCKRSPWSGVCANQVGAMCTYAYTRYAEGPGTVWLRCVVLGPALTSLYVALFHTFSQMLMASARMSDFFDIKLHYTCSSDIGAFGAASGKTDAQCVGLSSDIQAASHRERACSFTYATGRQP